MGTKTIRKRVSFRLHPDLVKRLKENAKAANKSLNSYVEEILTNYISEPKEARAKTSTRPIDTSSEKL